MISLLAATVVGSWTYAGFLAEPAPTPAPAPAAPVASVRTVAEALLERTKEEAPPAPNPNPAPAPAPATKPEATPPPIAPSPTRHRLTDATGQIWEHTDPAYLARFVATRNGSFPNPPVTFTYSSAQPARASRCSGGRCN
jgi:hypothetical protein